VLTQRLRQFRSHQNINHLAELSMILEHLKGEEMAQEILRLLAREVVKLGINQSPLNCAS
jgi:hypothetical protein